MNTKPESFPPANFPFHSSVCSSIPQTPVSRANFWKWNILMIDFIWKSHSSWKQQISTVHLTHTTPSPAILISCFIIKRHLDFSGNCWKKKLRIPLVQNTYSKPAHHILTHPQRSLSWKKTPLRPPTLHQPTPAYSTGIRHQSHQRTVQERLITNAPSLGWSINICDKISVIHEWDFDCGMH